MPDAPRIIYWDACVFLSYINGDKDRLPTLDVILDEAKKKMITLVTSTVSRVEVAYQTDPSGKKLTTPAVNAAIDRVFEPPTSPVVPIEFHSGIARAARRIIQRSVELNAASSSPLHVIKPMDAVHLASAASVGAAEFQTYDPKLLGTTVDAGVKICEPTSAQIPLGLVT